jgi:ribosomal protein S20
VSLERCPACRVRLAQEPVCPRCGCDLTLVRRAEAQARQATVRALHAWAQGDREAARTLVHAALRIERSALARAVLQSLGAPRESSRVCQILPSN